MKRVLLIGIVLAICILAMPQGVLAVAPGTGVPVVVDAAYGASAATDFNAVIHQVSGIAWSWDLVAADPNLNLKSPAIDFTLSTLAPWSVTAYESYAPPATPYVGAKGHMHGDLADLQTPFEMTTAQSGGGWYDFTPYTSAASQLAVKSGTSSTSPQPWSENLRQAVTATDLASHGGYHTQLTFTCTAPF
jgi:hypothetical protein